MLTLFNQEINTIAVNNNNLLIKLISLTNLDKSWSSNKFLNLEIKKSFIRAALRYSKESVELLNKILPEIKDVKQFQKLDFITRVYPMIHLKNDLSEESNYHFDQSDNNDLFTCWLPITSNEYNPINILKFNNKFLKRLLVRVKMPNFLSSEINPKLGSLSFWDGHTLHKGNLNTTNKIACAYQLKISKKKFVYEFSQNKSKNFDLEEIDVTTNYNDKYDLFLKLIDSLNNINIEMTNLSMICKQVKINLEKLFTKKDREISFALSILSQRINTNGKKLNIENFQTKSIIYDISSILLGSENLISIERVCKNIKKNETLKLLYEQDFLNCIPKNSYEWNAIILKNNMN